MYHVEFIEFQLWQKNLKGIEVPSSITSLLVTILIRKKQQFSSMLIDNTRSIRYCAIA